MKIKLYLIVKITNDIIYKLTILKIIFFFYCFVQRMHQINHHNLELTKKSTLIFNTAKLFKFLFLQPIVNNFLFV